METNFDRTAPEKQRAAEFLRTHLPLSDLECYENSMFLSFIEHALALRKNAPWCAELDEEIFFHYVLFPRVNDEDLSFHRDIFRDALWDRIRDLPTTAEKVLEVNRWCHEMASYEMQDDRTASPLTVYRCGSGRCGEESAFLVSALRSVGIAARQVYAPRWAHCDDNHAWVEALCDGTWRFLGACEPEPILDRGWFNSPASRALLVHSRAFGEANHPLHGEKINTEWGITWFNQTSRYAFTRRRTLRAEVDGQSAPALFHIQVLNESSFHTIATLHANAHGEASIELGDGDFRIFARCGAYGCECDSGSDDTIVLPLQEMSFYGNDRSDSAWREADYFAPPDAPRNSAPLNAAQKQQRAAVLADGREKREARIAAMLPADAENSPNYDLLRAARGNAAVVAAFLSSDREKREKLLRTLSEKDLRDVTEDLLLSHLHFTTPQDDLPDEIYFPYVLSPRIAIEPLTPWREELQRLMTEEEKAKWRKDPLALWSDLFARHDRIPLRFYRNLVHTPAAAFRSNQCTRRSIDLLFVAILRTLGVPARLSAQDGVPEYYLSGIWHKTEELCNTTLLLHTGENAVYRQNWTLSRWEMGEWTLLHPENAEWTDGALTLSLPAGCYRLITSVRMPNGNQFSAMREIVLCPGDKKHSDLLFRSYSLADLLRCQRLPIMSAVTLEGGEISDICRTGDRPVLLFWLEEGGEPTEHILNELIGMRDAFGAASFDIRFLLRSREALQQRTLARALEEMPFVRVLFDDWAYDLEMTARHLTCDPDTPPLAVICDKNGNAVYGMSGYSVGAAELLLRIGEHIASV